MLKTELLEIIANGESSGLEFKRDDIRPEQQMRLFELGGMLHTEVMPVPRTDMSCLDDARLLNYLRDILRDPEVPQSAEAWQARLLGLGFLTML